MCPPADDSRPDKHHHSSHHHKSHHHQSRSHHHKSHHHHTKEKHRESSHRTKSPKRTKSPSRHQTHHSEHKSHHHHHHHHDGHAHGAHTRTTDTETGRHPSSSIGPGRVELVVSLFLILLAISAVALLSVGIWLLATLDGWPSGLNMTGSRSATQTFSYGTACIVIAILFIPLIILTILAAFAKRGSQARKLRLAIIFLASFCIFILLLMTITALLFATDPPFINHINERAWINSVQDTSNQAPLCNIQAKYGCEGWRDGSCPTCRPTYAGNYTTPFGTCTEQEITNCPRCWDYPARALSFVHVNPVHYSHTSRVAKKISQTHISSFVWPSHLSLNRISKFKKYGFFGRHEERLSRQEQQQKPVPGCFRYIEWRNHELFIPMCVFTIFLILILILLTWKVCIDSSGR